MTAKECALEWLDRCFGYALMMREAHPQDIAKFTLCAAMEVTSWTVAEQFIALIDQHEADPAVGQRTGTPI